MRFGGDQVTVALPGGCQCPGTPHAADEVYLLPRLGFEGGVEATAVIRRFVGADDPDGLDRPLIEVFLRHQVAGWNLLGEDGLPLPYSADLLLSDYTSCAEVGEAADGLYSEALLAPLRAAASKSSPGGPTGPSTSRTTRSGSRPRRR